MQIWGWKDPAGSSDKIRVCYTRHTTHRNSARLSGSAAAAALYI